MAAATHPGKQPLRARALLAAAALVIALPASTMGAQGHPHPATSFVSVIAPDGQAIPLINAGDVFKGVTFDGIPDGIGIVPVSNGKQQVDLYVTMEQSHVPFSGFADYQDSSVQRARLDLKSGQIVDLATVLPASAGFIRFCSATMVGPAQGFSDYTFLVNEESNDILDIPANAPYPSDPPWATYRQAGYSVWLDAKSGAFKTIPGAGRMNHENTMVVPGGWSGIYALTGDDTFSAPSSQLYMYGASSPGAFKQDKGSLWAFQVTEKNDVAVDPADAFNGANDYLDITVGDDLAGQFIEVPGDIARGTHGGNPQSELETWSNEHNVFQFIRIEDLAYDANNPRTVYFADTGSTVQHSTATTGPTAGRMISGGTAQRGRVFKLVMNADDPTVVDSFSVLADGNNASSNFLRPDNIGSGTNGLMVQEDNSPVISGGVVVTPTNNDIWFYSFEDETWTKVASVTQPQAETSGIIDASAWLGAGWWVFDIQSHETQHSFSTTGSYTVPVTGAVISPFTIRRELGQLSLLYIPGS